MVLAEQPLHARLPCGADPLPIRSASVLYRRTRSHSTALNICVSFPDGSPENSARRPNTHQPKQPGSVTLHSSVGTTGPMICKNSERSGLISGWQPRNAAKRRGTAARPGHRNHNGAVATVSQLLCPGSAASQPRLRLECPASSLQSHLDHLGDHRQHTPR